MIEPLVDFRVRIGDESVSARFDPGPPNAPVFVCAHGAGGHMNDRGLAAVSAALVAAGLGVVRFNFPYREKQSGRPDAMPRLQASLAAVVERTRAELAPATLIVGGRSMGGRAASMMVASGLALDGLLLLAYPLHPAGRPDTRRDAHLPDIAIPTICFNGTRDALCDRRVMESVLPRLRPTWTMHWLEGADHSFHVLKSSGRSDADVLAEVAAATREWVATLGSR
jgi:predicted alpha/beta-hydrolase family hydrolase